MTDPKDDQTGKNPNTKVSEASTPSRDMSQWDALASGKIFAVMHEGELVFGREERDRKSWQAKVSAKASAKKRAGATGATAADHEPKATEPRRDGASAGNDPLDRTLSAVEAQLEPMAQLDRCLADLNSNHHKLAAYTEKSIRYLWQETRALLARHGDDLAERQKTFDQLALQNRSLKAENKALSARLTDDRKEPSL